MLRTYPVSPAGRGRIRYARPAEPGGFVLACLLSILATFTGGLRIAAVARTDRAATFIGGDSPRPRVTLLTEATASSRLLLTVRSAPKEMAASRRASTRSMAMTSGRV